VARNERFYLNKQKQAPDIDFSRQRLEMISCQKLDPLGCSYTLGCNMICSKNYFMIAKNLFTHAIIFHQRVIQLVTKPTDKM